MTPESGALLHLGRTILAEYARLPGVACAAITGSSAEGHADHHSDLDMTVYYDALPPGDALAAVRTRLSDGSLIWKMGAYDDGEFAESFRVRGIEAQIGHTTVARWEATIADVLAGKEPGSPAHKAMSGTLVSIPVVGAERLAAWQARIGAYSDDLRRAMVTHHLKVPRVWRLAPRLENRDARLWVRQMLVEGSFNLLGVSAGLSRRYFTAFQFKRSRAFIDSLAIAPPRLADRLEALWDGPPLDGAERLRELLADTVALVERELPEVDTRDARAAVGSGR